MENNEVNLEMVRTIVAEEAATAGIELSEEQLDELSKETLGRYVKKAALSHSDSNVKAAEHKRNAEELGRLQHGNSPAGKKALAGAQAQAHNDTSKELNTANKRAFGIHRAVNKLVKEDLEVMIGHCVNSQPVEFAESFNVLVRTVIENKIEGMRKEVGASLFGEG